MTADRLALANSLEDRPRWCLARAALLSGRCDVTVSACGAASYLVQADASPLATLVGAPTAALTDVVLDPSRAPCSIFVPAEQTNALLALLPGWRARPCTLHLHASPESLPRPRPSARRIAASEPLEWPTEWDGIRRRVLAGAPAAGSFEADRFVSVCHTVACTESLWDAAIDTVELARRGGHGTGAFHALARELLAEGREPLWGCFDSNVASISMAGRLGFVAVDCMSVVTHS